MEHRLPKPLGTGVVPPPQDPTESAFRLSDNCELCAATQAGLDKLGPPTMPDMGRMISLGSLLPRP